MRRLAAAPDSFDRISTPEELKQVVELLIDLDGPESIELTRVPQPTGSSLPEMQVSWEDFGAEEEPSAMSDSAALATLFSRMHGRTN